MPVGTETAEPPTIRNQSAELRALRSTRSPHSCLAPLLPAVALLILRKLLETTPSRGSSPLCDVGCLLAFCGEDKHGYVCTFILPYHWKRQFSKSEPSEKGPAFLSYLSRTPSSLYILACCFQRPPSCLPDRLEVGPCPTLSPLQIYDSPNKVIKSDKQRIGRGLAH